MSDATAKKSTSSKALQGQGAYARLLDDIQNGTLPPGSRLTETDIAARFEISRTPVREAIRKLEADGLVSHKPRAGAVVRQLTYPEIMELYEMRYVLEGTAARLAARSASSVEIEELASINADMAQDPEDGRRMFDLNRQFHTTLIAAARNRFLVKSVRSIDITMRILGPSTLQETARAREAIEEHDQVIAALRNRDESTAETAMRAHMESAQRTRLRQLRSAGKLIETEGEDTE